MSSQNFEVLVIARWVEFQLSEDHEAKRLISYSWWWETVCQSNAGSYCWPGRMKDSSLHSWGQLGFDKMLLGYLLISSVWCNSRRFMDRHSIHICCRHSRNSSSSSSSNSELAVTSCFHSWWCAWSSPSAEGTNWQLPKSKTVIRLIMIKLLEVPPLQAAHCMITIWTTEVNCLFLHRLPSLFPVLGRGIWGYLCPLALRPPSMQESQKEVVTTPLYLSPSSYSGGSSLFKAWKPCPW